MKSQSIRANESMGRLVFYTFLLPVSDEVARHHCHLWNFWQLYCSVSVWDGRPVCHEVRASHREALWLRQRSQLQLLPAQVHLKLRGRSFAFSRTLLQDRASSAASADSSRTSTLTSLTSSFKSFKSSWEWAWILYSLLQHVNVSWSINTSVNISFCYFIYSKFTYTAVMLLVMMMQWFVGWCQF